MYQFELPSDNLSHLVNRFYEVKVPHASTFDDNQLIPYSLGTINFVVKGNGRIKCINGIENIPSSFLSGQHFPTFSFDNNEPLLFCGIGLKPTATSKLFRINLAQLKNRSVNLADIMDHEVIHTHNKLKEAASTNARFNVLTDFINQLLPVDSKYSYLDVLIDLIYQKEGMIKVSELCDYADVSRRYLEKKSKK